jgi:hypothetical protein
MNASVLALYRPIGVLLLLLVPTITAQATQLEQMSLDELGRTASTVVQGKVLTTHSYWNPDHTKIFTEILVESDVTHKGPAAGSVRIVQLGGTVDNVRVTVHGALGWTPGEEVLLFLEPYKANTFVVTGLSQGKFGIVRDERTGEVFASRAPAAGAKGAGNRANDGGHRSIEKMPLTRLLDEALGTGAGR